MFDNFNFILHFSVIEVLSFIFLHPYSLGLYSADKHTPKSSVLVMDSSQAFSFTWDPQGPTYTSRTDNLFGDPSFHTSAPFQTSGYITQSSNDVQMEGADIQLDSQSATTTNRPGAITPSSRPRNERLDWSAHYATIKQLYIDENKSLPQTKEIMEQNHSFRDS